MVTATRTSRIAVLGKTGVPIETTTIDVPAPGPGAILARVHMGGVCGTDVHLRRGDFDLPFAIVLGHEEGTAFVEELGEGVTHDSAGVPLQHLAGPDVVRFELFAAPDSADLDRGFERGFEVELAHTGATFTVEPGESILQKAIDAGADVGSDCQDGICGSCETPILAGEAEHRDHVLTEKEKAANACMMICVSRALSERLVLDL